MKVQRRRSVEDEKHSESIVWWIQVLDSEKPNQRYLSKVYCRIVLSKPTNFSFLKKGRFIGTIKSWSRFVLH